MLSVGREVVRSSGLAWDDDDDLDLDDEPISEPRSEVCGGVTSWDGFDLNAITDLETDELRARKVKETFENEEKVKRVVDKIYLGGVEVKQIAPHAIQTPRFSKIVSIMESQAMPWYGQPGRGIQYFDKMPVAARLKSGFLSHVGTVRLGGGR